MGIVVGLVGAVFGMGATGVYGRRGMDESGIIELCAVNKYLSA